MIQPNKDEIWIGTNTGITVLNANNGQEKNQLIKTTGTVKSLLVDQSGLIWAGIDGYGLGKHIPQTDIKLFNKGLNIKSVGAVCEIDEEIWIGTRGDGVYRLNKTTNTLIHIDISSQTAPENDGFIRDILYENESVWVATN